MRNERLRWLMGIALLVGAWMLLLDWRDELVELRREAQAASAQRSREQLAIGGLNWMGEAARARQVRLDWLARFLEADTAGLMRVTALEHIKTLCDEARAGCQVGLIGEGGGDAAALPLPAAGKTPRGDGPAALPAGAHAVKVKLSLGFAPEALMRLLARIEAGDKIIAIDRLVVSGPRAELQLSVFGVDAAEARKLRAASALPGGTGS